MNRIKFTKMHGLGNDFMVIDGVNQSLNLSKQDLINLSNRATGIGFDQCLIIEPSKISDIDFNYKIFNADGNEVGQCGNGARCLARFAQRYGLTDKNELTVATYTTQMKLLINKNETVTVEMAKPKLNPADIPFLAPKQSDYYSLPLSNGKTVSIHIINVGNPHAILVVNEVQSTQVNELGQQISLHSLFPQQVNAGFMQITDASHISLRVFERGCGETQACGSGAVAAAAIGRLFYGLNERITVNLLGGELIIDWPNLNGPIYLTGPAVFIYEGKLL